MTGVLKAAGVEHRLRAGVGPAPTCGLFLDVSPVPIDCRNWSAQRPSAPSRDSWWPCSTSARSFLVQADVPRGKHQGSWTGRLTTRTRGDFVIKTAGQAVAVPHRVCRVLQRKGGWAYAQQTRSA